MNIGRYINYFRNLAVTHAQIQHSVPAELGNEDASAKRFTTFGNNEVIQGLSNTIGFPALLIELYDTNLASETVHDVKQFKTGSFMVLDSAEVGSVVSEQQAYVTTEKITYDILQKIWQDHYGAGNVRCLTPFKFFDFNKITITPTGKLFTNEFGWYVQFAFLMHNEPALNTPIVEGTFGLTNYLSTEDGIPITTENP